LFATATTTPKEPFVTSAITGSHFVNILALAIRAAWRISPALEFKKLHGGRFIGANPWDIGDDFRLFPFWMFSIHLGIILLNANRIARYLLLFLQNNFRLRATLRAGKRL
jgi:hypothetical protein